VAVAILLAYFYIDPEKTWRSLRSISALDFTFTIMMITASFLAAGARWAVVCRGIGIVDVSTWTKIKLNYASAFVDMISPVYGGSDAYCAYSVASKRENSGAASLMSVLVSRLSGYFVAIFICVVCSYFLEIKQTWREILLSLFFFVPIIILFSPRLIKMIPLRFNKVKSFLSLSQVSGDSWMKAFSLSILAQFFLISSRAWVGWSIGLDLSWIEYAFISSVLLILTPITPSFGFIGLGTVTFVSLAAYFGANPETATAMSIVWYACWVVMILPGFLFLKDLDSEKLFAKIAAFRSAF